MNGDVQSHGRGEEVASTRLLQLEADVAMLKHMMLTGPSSQRMTIPTGVDSSSSSSHDGSADDDDDYVPRDVGPATMSREDRMQHQAEMELRRVVPHLSPEFNCKYNDLILIMAAIRRGGLSSTGCGTTGNKHTDVSLQDRLQMMEAEKRHLQQKLNRQANESEELKREVGELKERMKAVQQSAKLSAANVAQKRDELRLQLQLEETRSQKLRARNTKLESEMALLRDRVRRSV